MANSWFNPTGNPITRAFGLSSLMRNELAAIGRAFDRMPNPLGSTSKGFSGGTWDSGTLSQPNVQGGTIGSAASPVVSVSYLSLLGGGSGYAAGALPQESGTLGAFFRMATTAHVGYARSDASGTPKVSFFFDEFRSLVMGNDADEGATSATEGFLYIPSVNGAPSGAPAAYTGAVPLVYDRSNNRLYVRSGGTWRYAAVA